MDDKRLDRIENRLDSIDYNLEKHMKRSDNLEEQIKPMKELMVDMRAFYRVLKILAVIATIVEGFRLIK
jgi:archaellum component FlaC